MLRLARRPGETIVITAPDGTEIPVTVHALQGNRAIIDIEAPRNYIIDRAEVHERKKREAAGEEVDGNVMERKS